MVFLTAGLSPLFAESKAIQSDPGVVELIGVISRQDFPGRPNYESIEKGDEKETYWILSVSKPTTFQGLQELQLILSSAQYQSYQPLIGKKVHVSGTLMEGTTAHHKTPVLLEIQSMELSP